MEYTGFLNCQLSLCKRTEKRMLGKSAGARGKNANGDRMTGTTGFAVKVSYASKMLRKKLGLAHKNSSDKITCAIMDS